MHWHRYAQCHAAVCGRYSGYIAWRGVMQAGENPKVAEAVRTAYSGMGDTLYFDIARGTHAVVYELPEERVNWLWYACYAVPCFACFACCVILYAQWVV